MSAPAGTRRRRRALGLVAATVVIGGAVAASCGGEPAPAELPPLGEALLVVDTDAPVPRFVSRLRVDLYSADGASWYESRDIALVDERDWPASFSLYTPDQSGAAHRVLVRLRAYPHGRVRDYLGERPVNRAADAAPGDPGFVPAPDGGAPRLLRDDADVTPPTEPSPFVTIDRLLLVDLAYGHRGSVRVTLHGACFGSMADLAGLTTCVDTEGAVAAVPAAALDADRTVPTQGRPKTFGADAPCPAGVAPRPGSKTAADAPLRDEEVCVPGGVFRFGSPVDTGVGEASNAPERMAIISPFLLDKYEVSVARWRDAVARGFVPPSEPKLNQGGMVHDTCAFLNFGPGGAHWCPYTKHEGDYEDYALTCVEWEAARAFCQFEGGDLPTEAQWEWVALAYGRREKSLYPWGDDLSCRPAAELDRAVYARMSYCQGAINDRDECLLPSEGSPSCADSLHSVTPSGQPENCCQNKALAGTCCPGGYCCDAAPDPELCRKCQQYPQLGQCKKSPPYHVENPRMGPQPVALLDTPTGDRSVGVGAVNLGGNAAEWTRDALRRLDSACWTRAPLRDPACLDDAHPTRGVRGGSWTAPARLMRGTDRHTRLETVGAWEFGVPQVGFRCARPAVAP